MAQIKTYKVSVNGENVPSYISKYVEQYNGKQVTKDLFYCLDQDINFIVCDCKDAHGNTTKSDKSAWLCAKDNKWNISFEVE